MATSIAQYMVTVDNGYGGGTAAYGMSYTNPVYSPAEALKIAQHPRNRELAPVLYRRNGMLGEWVAVRITETGPGLYTVTPDYSVAGTGDERTPATDAPASSEQSAPVSARTVVRGDHWEIELLSAHPAGAIAASNVLADVIAEWITDASSLTPMRGPGPYFRPYAATDAPYSRKGA